jgi:glucose-1-phosphate adenylyltransferase
MTPFRTSQALVAVVLAGGRGQRLHPLTRDRSKPAVPFGGKYRIIDFTLSNLVNSGCERIYVLTQYKAQSLLEHLQRAWITVGSRDSFITAVPAQMRAGGSWYRGTADAIHQNLNLLHRSDPTIVAVFGADHIYKMNVQQMVDFHVERRSDCTVACLPVPVDQARSLGVVEIDEHGRIVRFYEKPQKPVEMPHHKGYALASMGNYLFDRRKMIEVLEADAGDPSSSHDFGKDLIPGMIENGRVFAYDFQRNSIPLATEDERSYWRDIGTLDAYFQANLDLKNVVPKLNLYSWSWPIRTASYNDPPAKFVFDEEGRRGQAVQSIVAGGCILAGGRVKDSVLGRNVLVEAGAEVVDSILLDNVRVEHGARVHRAIIDKNVSVPADSRVSARAWAGREDAVITDTGIVVVPRGEDSPEWTARNF